MFVELIELLRCPHEHEESQLIAAATRTEARRVVEGTLGCPTCGAEFAIHHGVAHFGTPPAQAPNASASAEAAMRLAAFLDLSTSAGVAVICGEWSNHVEQLRRLTDVPLVLVNPPAEAARLDVAAVVEVADHFPFAAASCHAAALSREAPERLTTSIVRAIRPGGRVVARASLRLPDGVTEIVRDEREWVGERVRDAVPTRPIALKRNRPPG